MTSDLPWISYLLRYSCYLKLFKCTFISLKQASKQAIKRITAKLQNKGELPVHYFQLPFIASNPGKSTHKLIKYMYTFIKKE